MVAMSPDVDAQPNKSRVCEHLKSDAYAEQVRKGGDFSWSPVQRGWVLSGFFYGYFLTPMVGGAAGAHWGARRTLGVGVVLAGAATLLTPPAAALSPWALFAVRLVVGVGAGVGFPSLHSLIGVWIPKGERTAATAVIYSGVPVGCSVALVGGALLIRSRFLSGWPPVFYLTGGLTCLWFVLWSVLVYESPQDHPFIRESELHIITGGVVRKTEGGMRRVPWLAILRSGPFYALCLAHLCNNWGFYLQLTEVPTFLEQVLHMDILENGALSALPYAAFVLLSPPAAFAVDRLRTQGTLPITTLRKIANSVAMFVPAACVSAVPFVGCHKALVISLLALSTGFNGLMLSGFKVTHIDMSPEFGGILMAGTNTVANLAGMIAPLFVGKVQEDYLTMFLENQLFPDHTIDEERISRAINNDHTAAAPPTHNKKGECIHVCLVCQKAFKSPAFYRKHLRLHGDSSRAPCPTCGKGVRRHLLAAHARLKHKHQPPPPSSSKSNTSSGVSVGSKRTRGGGEQQRPFCCSLCPKSFNIKSSLQRHLSCHTGEKPFLCGLCGRGYTRRSVLQLHVQQVHEARKPFECATCGLRFSQKGNLQAHHRRKHTPAPHHHHHPPMKKTKRPRQPPSSSSLHTYANKVKAIVSRGRQRFPEPPPPSSSVDSRSSSLSEEEMEGGVPLPDLDSLLEGAWGGECMAAGGEWEADCPLFTADDLDEIGEISGNIYGLDRHCSRA